MVHLQLPDGHLSAEAGNLQHCCWRTWFLGRDANGTAQFSEGPRLILPHWWHKFDPQTLVSMQHILTNYMKKKTAQTKVACVHHVAQSDVPKQPWLKWLSLLFPSCLRCISVPQLPLRSKASGWWVVRSVHTADQRRDTSGAVIAYGRIDAHLKHIWASFVECMSFCCWSMDKKWIIWTWFLHSFLIVDHSSPSLPSTLPRRASAPC